MQLPKRTVVRRDKLYFGKFKYRLTFDLPGSAMTEYRRTVEDFEIAFNLRRMENAAAIRKGVALPWPDLDFISPDAIASLIVYREKYHPLRTTATVAGIYSYWNSVRVFTNDLTIVHEAIDIGGSNYALAEVDKTDVPPGVMLFARQPKFKYRTYFREKRVDQQWKDNMIHLFANTPGLVPCESLKCFLKLPAQRYHGSRLLSSHFVDYGQPSLRMVLDLFLDRGYLRQHYELKQRE